MGTAIIIVVLVIIVIFAVKSGIKHGKGEGGWEREEDGCVK